MSKQVYDIIQFLKDGVDEMQFREKGEIWCWMPYSNLEQFIELIDGDLLGEGGLDAKLQSGTVFFVANEILGYFGIDCKIFDD